MAISQSDTHTGAGTGHLEECKVCRRVLFPCFYCVSISYWPQADAAKAGRSFSVPFCGNDFGHDSDDGDICVVDISDADIGDDVAGDIDVVDDDFGDDDDDDNDDDDDDYDDDDDDAAPIVTLAMIDSLPVRAHATHPE